MFLCIWGIYVDFEAWFLCTQASYKLQRLYLIGPGSKNWTVVNSQGRLSRLTWRVRCSETGKERERNQSSSPVRRRRIFSPGRNFFSSSSAFGPVTTSNLLKSLKLVDQVFVASSPSAEQHLWKSDLRLLKVDLILRQCESDGQDVRVRVRASAAADPPGVLRRQLLLGHLRLAPGPVLSSRGRDEGRHPVSVRLRLRHLRADRLHRQPHHRKKPEQAWSQKVSFSRRTFRRLTIRQLFLVLDLANEASVLAVLIKGRKPFLEHQSTICNCSSLHLPQHSWTLAILDCDIRYGRLAAIFAKCHACSSCWLAWHYWWITSTC